MTSITRRIASFVGHSSAMRKVLVTTPGVRDLAWRFVAGEDLDGGIAAVRGLNAGGIAATLNHVGTHVRDEKAAVAASDEAVACLRRIAADGVDSNLSLKLTQIGLDVDEALCRTQLARVLDCARETASFVRVDMEESRYVDRTLAIFEDVVGTYGADRVGIVLQSYLRGRGGDVERAIERGWSVRIVKGGYWESAEVVYRNKAEIDAAFASDVEKLVRRGRRAAIATHDTNVIARARRAAVEAGVDRGSFEFQMLYGVRADLQKSLVGEGYRVRCYVPFGTQWYEYFLGCVRRVPGGALQRVAEPFRKERR